MLANVDPEDEKAPKSSWEMRTCKGWAACDAGLWNQNYRGAPAANSTAGAGGELDYPGLAQQLLADPQLGWGAAYNCRFGHMRAGASVWRSVWYGTGYYCAEECAEERPRYHACQCMTEAEAVVHRRAAGSLWTVGACLMLAFGVVMFTVGWLLVGTPVFFSDVFLAGGPSVVSV